MNENLPSGELEWTGERYLPRIGGAIELEHLHRYFVARQLVSGKRVLDIASGEGYGSDLLAQAAARVTGVDISAQAVSFARSKYVRPNLEFKVGSCAQIPLDDHSVDVVVSFETIEHHTQHHEMMGEIKRVLVPGGILIISSPEKYEYSDRTGYSNPFHVKELYRDEFANLLDQYFRSHVMLGQRVLYGSAIVSESDSSGFLHAAAAKDQPQFNPGLHQPLYLLAVAGDGQLPTSFSSLLEDDVMTSNAAQALVDQVSSLTQQVEAIRSSQQTWQSSAQEWEKRCLDAEAGSDQARVSFDHRIGSLSQSLASLSDLLVDARSESAANRLEIDGLRQQLSEKDRHIQALGDSMAAEKETIAFLQAELAERGDLIRRVQEDTRVADQSAQAKALELAHLRRQFNEVLQSRSWRALSPLRFAVNSLKGGGRAPNTPIRVGLSDRLRMRHDILLGSALREIRGSQLFDAEYYLANNPDVRITGADPATHYLLHGWRELRDPSAAFSTGQYLSGNPDVARSRTNPLLHYLRHGLAEGRSTGVAPTLVEPTIESIHLPAPVQTAAPEPEPTPTTTLAIDTTRIDGEIEDIRRSGLFDESFYLSMYTELQPPPADPIRHYCEQGWQQGRNPSDDFDTNFYLSAYSDIRNAGLNPFWHYVIAGASELRHALPDLSQRYEGDIWFGSVDSDVKLVAFYLTPDWTALRKGRPAAFSHSPPPTPAEDPGFYDPTDGAVLKRQSDLARRHGIRGFCFRLDTPEDRPEGQPIDAFLRHPDIDFQFCTHLDLSQPTLTAPHLERLSRALRDRRHIRCDGRPVVLVTARQALSSQLAPIISDLRRYLVGLGMESPFVLGRCHDHAKLLAAGSPTQGTFDGLLDLPDAPVPAETGGFVPIRKNGIDLIPYRVVASQGMTRAEARSQSGLPVLPVVTLARDNSVSNPDQPLLYTRFHLRDYRRWLDAAVCAARSGLALSHRFAFINAWNDWNECLVLEPDRLGGHARLNETTRALLGLPQGMVMPKVSVIVPNYNHERFLRRRLDSIYGQTYRNIEVILLDDCSSDGSREVMREYAVAHPEITLTIFNEQNSGGVFRQWARGIQSASGDLVWIAESDDYCDLNFLEVLVRCFDDEAVLLAHSKCVFVDRDESVMPDEFSMHVQDLPCASKWERSHVETAHVAVKDALGAKNTIPNASGAIFRRPIDMPLLDDPAWLSMRVAGDWVFYLHQIRGGKIAYSVETTNFFRRYPGSTAETSYRKDVFYREVAHASRHVASLYPVPTEVLERCRDGFKRLYDYHLGRSHEEFSHWYDFESILDARKNRLPNIMVCTMGFYPGGAEILPIRLANEFKRQGHSVLLMSAGLNPREDGVRRMVRNDVPLVETASVETLSSIIHDFGIEALNTHQWHIQKYPLQVPEVFDELRSHVASLHGMIEHGDAFGVTEEQLRAADDSVTTWVFTAEKNLGPFADMGLLDRNSPRFLKLPNGMQPPRIDPVPRAGLGIPDDAFVLCCVSRAIVDKGWAETIQVIARARQLSGRDIRLILVGNGPVYDEYCRSGVPDFVSLVGFSENSVGHYAAADMGIMLTKFKSESFPLTVVDCLFAGRPYIASDVGDIRNMLTSGDQVAGDLIKLIDWEVPIDAAAEVVADFARNPVKYRQSVELVQDVVGRYRIDVVAMAYVDLFKRDGSVGQQRIARQSALHESPAH